MTEHAEIAWTLVGGLLLIIGFFVAGWMGRADKNHDSLTMIVGEHEKEIAILKTETATIITDIRDIKYRLEEAQKADVLFRDEIRNFMGEILQHVGPK